MMPYKTALVNFETFFKPEEQRHDIIMQDIKQAADAGCNIIVGLLLADGFLHCNNSEFFKLMEQIRVSSQELGITDLFLLPGMLPGLNVPGYTVLKSFDYNLHMAYSCYKDKMDFLLPWNNQASKFLFLGGVPDRANRIGLLKRFDKLGALDSMVFSFFAPWTPEQDAWCRKEYADSDYDDFIKRCERSIDDVYSSSKEYGTSSDYDWSKGWVNDPAWIDPAVYDNTLFSVVSEGLPDAGLSSSFITEKTWRVFAQRHPFILAANREMTDYVKSLGFKTFDFYTSAPLYSYAEPEQVRLDVIAENAQQFLSVCHYHEDAIRADVEHNYQHFFMLGETNYFNLMTIKSNLNITDEDMKWFKKGFGHLIR